MGTIILNNTSDMIHVRVTATGESGSESFVDIAPQDSAAWDRNNWQVAFVLRDDDGSTTTLVVQPSYGYPIQ
jgi:hypothetical protein